MRLDALDVGRLVTRGLHLLGDEGAGGAAVLVPLVPSRDDGGWDVVLEVRAATLDVQPGEVCLPGGGGKPGETPRETAVRETAEELLVDPGRVHVLASLGTLPGPTPRPLHAFVGTIDGYDGSFGTDEVASTFRVPLAWLLSHEPRRERVALRRSFGPDFPWELIPGGRSYPWGAREDCIPFYETDPVIWGATARVLDRLARALARGVDERAV